MVEIFGKLGIRELRSSMPYFIIVVDKNGKIIKIIKEKEESK